MKALGDKIRELRKERTMTLRALAKAVGLSAPFVSDLERGRRETDKLTRFADVLGVPVSVLTALDERPKNLAARVAALERRLAALEERTAEAVAGSIRYGGYDGGGPYEYRVIGASPPQKKRRGGPIPSRGAK